MKKMLGGALATAATVCPPGFLCMDTGFVLFVSVVLGALLWGIYLHTRKDTPLITEPVRRETIVVAEPNVPSVEYREHQREYDRKRPTAPERDYSGPADVRGFIPPPGVPIIPINIPTQGLPEQFQQVGVLTAPGGTATSATPNRTILPLFGRKVAVSKERYNYYTRSDGINPMQVPVSFKNRDCEDDNGCDEISNGDTVAVPILGQTYVATTYRYTLPRYIPYVS
jgi:hypothetical protein